MSKPLAGMEKGRAETGRSGGMDCLLNEELLEVHADDLAAWRLEDGGLAVNVPAYTSKPRRAIVRAYSHRPSATAKITAEKRTPGTPMTSSPSESRKLWTEVKG